MTDKRAVINPFTKNGARMRRNTTNTKWVPSGSSVAPLSQPGPGKPVQHTMQPFQHVSRSARVYTPDGEREQSWLQTQSPVLTAAIYNTDDLREMPDYALPRTRSWASLRGSVRNGDMTSSTTDPNVSSLSQGKRIDSDVTLFPLFETSFKESTKVTRTQWNVADIYRNAREIYDVGPEGEGQKLWSTFTHSKKQKKDHTRVSGTQTGETPVTRRPSAPGLTAHPPSAALQMAAASAYDEPLKITSGSQARKDSAVSRTSYELPVGISLEIQRVVDVSKPLPPIPHVVDDSKPLPPVPQLQPAPRPKPRATGNTVSNVPSGVQYPTQWRGNKSTGNHSTSKTKDSKADPWYKSLANLIPDEHVPFQSHRKPNADILKSKISRPRPFTAIQEGRTANVALECGGVGGPGAATSRFPNRPQAEVAPSPYPACVDLTQSRRSPHERLTTRQQGKQKISHEQIADNPVSRHWRDKLIGAGGSTGRSVMHKGRSRKDSDASFACQGIEQNHGAYVGEPGPSRQTRQGDGDGALGWEDESMRPEALFARKRDGDWGERDTRFYQPYVEVLDEYQD